MELNQASRKYTPDIIINMAFESYYWKKDIRKDISTIQRKMEINLQTLTSKKLDEVCSIVEIKVFLIAFAIRKLLDTKKIPDRVAAKKIKIIKFKRNSRAHGAFFNFKKLYELDKPIKADMEAKLILNQIIHGFVFQVFANKSGKLSHLYITSDYDKSKFLYLVNIKTLMKNFKEISKQQVVSMSIKYDPSRGIFVTTTN